MLWKTHACVLDFTDDIVFGKHLTCAIASTITVFDPSQAKTFIRTGPDILI